MATGSGSLVYALVQRASGSAVPISPSTPTFPIPGQFKSDSLTIMSRRPDQPLDRASSSTARSSTSAGTTSRYQNEPRRLHLHRQCRKGPETGRESSNPVTRRHRLADSSKRAVTYLDAELRRDFNFGATIVPSGTRGFPVRLVGSFGFGRLHMCSRVQFRPTSVAEPPLISQGLRASSVRPGHQGGYSLSTSDCRVKSGNSA